MLTLLMYAVCWLLFFKGVEIFQHMLCETMPVKSWRKWTIAIGVGSLALATVCAFSLAYQWTVQAYRVGKALEPLMR